MKEVIQKFLFDYSFISLPFDSILKYLSAATFGLGLAKLFISTTLLLLPRQTNFFAKVQRSKPELTRVPENNTILSTIVGTSLFDEVEDTVKKNGSVSEISIENPNFIVLGTLAGPREFANAVIQYKGNQGREYGIRDKIGTMQIIAIKREYIIIRLDGRNVKVEVGQQSEDAIKNIPRKPKVNSEKPSPLMQLSKYTLSRKLLKEIIANPNLVHKDIHLNPHNHSGKRIGLFVNHINQGCVFRKMGINHEDIIAKIGNTDLRETKNFVQALEAISDQSQFDITHRRGYKKERHWRRTTIKLIH